MNNCYTVKRGRIQCSEQKTYTIRYTCNRRMYLYLLSAGSRANAEHGINTSVQSHGRLGVVGYLSSQSRDNVGRTGRQHSFSL
ncbi:hypothetical protein TNCV_3439741 [Trichonephila clavipes]|nr:hypothetical protein TNCV_3439741 [Trichonephila clavipes]